MSSLPVPTGEEVRVVLRYDWTVTLLALGAMWFIIVLATVLAVWSAMQTGVPLGDPGILVPFLAIAAAFWSVPIIAAWVTWRRRRSALPPITR